jgi:hypothetical protein
MTKKNVFLLINNLNCDFITFLKNSTQSKIRTMQCQKNDILQNYNILCICLLDRCMCIKSTKSNLTEKRTFWGYVKNINF